VPAYRDVANALEEREQLRNLAQTNAARTLLSVVGEQAADALRLVVRPTNDMQRTEVGQPALESPPADDAAPFDWTLDEDRWQVLTADALGEGVLSGQVSARLHAARAQSRQTTDRATGKRDRFVPLVGPHQAAPQLSQTHLYWQSLEAALANRPLVVLDPAARGRRQFWLPAEAAPAPPPPPPAMAPNPRPAPEPFDDEQ